MSAVARRRQQLGALVVADLGEDVPGRLALVRRERGSVGVLSVGIAISSVQVDV